MDKALTLKILNSKYHYEIGSLSGAPKAETNEKTDKVNHTKIKNCVIQVPKALTPETSWATA